MCVCVWMDAFGLNAKHCHTFYLSYAISSYNANRNPNRSLKVAPEIQ